MPIPIDEFPELIFGKQVFARDVSSLESLVVRTIADVWKAYADDHFHFLIRADGPFDTCDPEEDIARLSVIRGNENHQCAGTLGMRGAKVAFIDAANARCTNVIAALKDEESAFPWSYVADLGGEGDTEIWVDDVDGASAIWVFG